SLRSVGRGHHVPAVVDATDETDGVTERPGGANSGEGQRLGPGKDQRAREVRVQGGIDVLRPGKGHEFACNHGKWPPCVLQESLAYGNCALVTALGLVQYPRILSRKDIYQGAEARLRLIRNLQARLIELERIMLNVELMDVRRITVRGVVRGRHIPIDRQSPGGDRVGPARHSGCGCWRTGLCCEQHCRCDRYNDTQAPNYLAPHVRS